MWPFDVYARLSRLGVLYVGGDPQKDFRGTIEFRRLKFKQKSQVWRGQVAEKAARVSLGELYLDRPHCYLCPLSAAQLHGSASRLHSSLEPKVSEWEKGHLLS